MDQFLQFLILGLQVSAPIAFAALGGVFSEKGGVINIGLEGMMVVTTFMIVWGGITFESFFVGVLIAMLAGAVMGLLHAFLTVTLRIDQIVSGVAINILAAGISRFLSQRLFGTETQSPLNTEQYGTVFNSLVDGGINAYALLLLPVTALAWYILRKTPYGLRLRSAGENPAAADTLGVKIHLIRYSGVIISGVMCGLAASVLYPTQWLTGSTGGRGFIALAAMIFGRWHPVGAVCAALLFGYAETLRIVYELNIPIPSQFVQMLPYVLAVVVLAGLVGRARAPAAVGKPYPTTDS